MAVQHVGVKVQSEPELKMVYELLVDAKFSEAHSISFEDFKHHYFSPRRGFAVAIDNTREILGVWNFGCDDGDVVCRAADVVQVAKAVFK